MTDAPLGRLPEDRHGDLDRARRLEWWTIGWMASVIAVMGVTMQSSQAMRSAWVEDLLSLVPPIVFLIAARFERRDPTPMFPFGFQRVNSLAFLVAAVALTIVGASLLVEAGMTLIKQERVTIGLVTLLGVQLWAGWLMIAALAYSIVPPVILGRMKLPVARRTFDKVLHTDAMMNKADWQTGLAGIGGIVGLGFGLWWADAVAAGAISLSILTDGIRAVRIATAELIDGAPRALDKDHIGEDALALESELKRHFDAETVCLRETGRFIRAEISLAPGQAPPPVDPPRADPDWRLAEISIRHWPQPKAAE